MTAQKLCSSAWKDLCLKLKLQFTVYPLFKPQVDCFVLECLGAQKLVARFSSPSQEYDKPAIKTAIPGPRSQVNLFS